MKIASVVMTHADPKLTADTVDSVAAWVGDRVLVLVDQAGWKEFRNAAISPAQVEPGFFHGCGRSPYRNSALGLKRLYEHWPDSDWFLYVEYDCLFLSDGFRADLKRAEARDCFCAGFDLRRFSGRLPLPDSLLPKTPLSNSYYLLGCCQFLSGRFLEKLNDIDFFDKLLDATRGHARGHFPGYRRWAYEEELWPTAAVAMGGNLYELACWKGPDRCWQPRREDDPRMHYSQGESSRWRGRSSAYSMRFTPAIEFAEVTEATSIVHPSKSLSNPIRVEAQLRRASVRRTPSEIPVSCPNESGGTNTSADRTRQIRKGSVSFAPKLTAGRLADADWVSDLGREMSVQGRIDETVALLEHATRLRPDFIDACEDLAFACLDCGDGERAREHFERVLNADPQRARALDGLAAVFEKSGNIKRARAHHDLAVRLRPDDVAARWNRAQFLLRTGDFEGGWIDFECRRSLGTAKTSWLPKPCWDGSPLNGRTLLLHAEDDSGDAIRFLRYARRIPKNGGRVLFQTPRDWTMVAANCAGIDSVMRKGDPLPGFDVRASVLSLPSLLRLVDPDSHTPYLDADPERRDLWKRRLAVLPGKKIGVAWRNAIGSGNDFRPSMPFAALVPLAELQGISLVGLQRVRSDELDTIRNSRLSDNFVPIEIEGTDLIEVAALVAELSNVVAIDSPIAELAGALGINSFVMLGARIDWRWQLHGAHTDWYPGMQLFRQRGPEDWARVVDDVALKLADSVARSAR